MAFGCEIFPDPNPLNGCYNGLCKVEHALHESMGISHKLSDSEFADIFLISSSQLVSAIPPNIISARYSYAHRSK